MSTELIAVTTAPDANRLGRVEQIAADLRDSWRQAGIELLTVGAQPRTQVGAEAIVPPADQSVERSAGQSAGVTDSVTGRSPAWVG